jgi:hypothetical protein
MILQSINDYIKNAQRIDEDSLLKHFRLSREGLSPMMEVLLKRGNINKVIVQRGTNLPAQVFYSWSDISLIPAVTFV